MKKNCQQEFECIDHETELAVKEIQLKKKVSENESEISKLRLQLTMRDGFQSALAAQKKQLNNIVSRFEADMFKLSKNLQGLVKLETKSQQSQMSLQTFLCSIKQTIGATLKTIGCKLQSQRTGEHAIIEQIQKSHAILKEETGNLYQQIIQQKNRQIQTLKNQLQKQKSESTLTLINKTSSMESLLRTLLEQQLKNTEIEQLRQEKSKLQKLLNSKNLESQQNINKVSILQRDLHARDQEIKQLRDEVANNRVVMATYQTRIEQQMEEVRQWREEDRMKGEEGRKKQIRIMMDGSMRQVRENIQELKDDMGEKNNEILDIVTKINRRLFDIENDTRERLEITYEKVCNLPQQLKKSEEIAQRSQREEIFGFKVPTAKRQTAALKFPVLTDEDFDF